MTSPTVFCLSVQLRPNNGTSHQTTKKHDTQSQRSQTSGSSVRALPIPQTDTTHPTSGIQTVASEQNANNHIIFLRGIRSDNGKIILTRDDNIRIQDGVLTVTNLNKTSESTSSLSSGLTTVERNDNDSLNDVILPTGSGRRVNGTPVLFYTSAGTAITGTVAGSSDLTNGNVAFITNDELQVGEFGDAGVQALKPEPEPEVKVVSTPLGSDGEPIKLPENLESLPKADHFPIQRHRWNTNEEIAAILISFERHSEWQSKEVRIRPKSGSMLLYSRKKVRYRRDGYCWKKRKDGKTTREDHMKLKVQGTECIYGCYVHSAILPTFHRRCYWLLQNPDIVLVHYLNVPYPDDNKLSCITPSLALWADKKEWTKEELVSQLKPMFFSEDEPDINNELEISTAETVEAIVTQLMEKQRLARQAALVKQLECGCPDSTCNATDGKQCSHPMRRIRGTVSQPQVVVSTGLDNKQPSANQTRDDANQVSSTTGSGGMLLSSPHTRIYNRERHSHNSNTPPLVLSLSQLQGGGGLLILNSNGAVTSAQQPVQVASFVCSPAGTGQHRASGQAGKKQQHQQQLVLKQEAMDTNTSCLHERDVNKMDVTNGNVSELYEGLSFNSQDKHLHHSPNNEIITLSSHSTPSKHMDTSEDLHHTDTFTSACDQSVILLSTNHTSLDKSHNNNANGTSPAAGTSNSSYFNETLDLSHEDIQRTLSANMPMCGGDEAQAHVSVTRTGVREDFKSKQQDDIHEPGVIVPEMNPMDFMDGTDIVVSPTHVVDDDVFVNLDAFDMLGDFPELEVLETNGDGTAGLLDVDKRATGQVSPHMDYREGTANITDYSPEWAYPEGGVKVLVTGPWYSTTSPYTVLFDTFPVPTTLVQSGVLRCYCPAHEAGLATLQVACEGFVISNSVMFEYKLPPHEDNISPTVDTKLERSTAGDSLLRFTLLHRLEAMDERLQIKQEPDAGSDGVEDSVFLQNPAFEDRLVTYCQTLTTRQWRHSMEEPTNMQYLIGLRGMTLLHLAASLGYCKLIATMLQWRAENSSLILDTEVDALSQDEEGYTPLMWACARGHIDTALMLYRWNHTALNVRNSVLQTALECARVNNHTELAKELEKLEYRREQDKTLCSPAVISPASSIISLASVASTSKSHDGVFLRPGAVNSMTGSISSLSRFSNNSHHGNNVFSFGNGDSFNNSKNTGQKLHKRPSVDSGINLGTSSDSLPSLRSRTNKSGRDIPKLSRFDRSMSLPLNSPFCITDNSFDGSSLDLTPRCPAKKMDYSTLSEASRCESPFVDVEALSDDDEDEKQHNVVGEQEVRVLTLAEQIIAAMPDRIKNEIEDMQLDNSPKPSDSLGPTDSLSDVFMEPLLDQTSSSFDNTEFNFEFSDHNYRYYDVGTPSSSLSPASSSCLQSPCSFTLDSPSPPPTTADFCEFFQASGSVFEKDFSNLTLSDREQRELYEAAKIIQKAYRSYKGRQSALPLAPPPEQPDRERAAAVLIQNYYRRYKQYAYFKQMTKAAMVIQSGYRSYCEHKRFKKSQEAAVCIQNYYRNYREQGGKGSREGTPASSGLKRTYSQRRQHQAARKIQQFMRQSKNKLQRERAERERQADPPSSVVRARSPFHVPSFLAVPHPTSSAGSDTADSGHSDISRFGEREMDINLDIIR